VSIDGPRRESAAVPRVNIDDPESWMAPAIDRPVTAKYMSV
jgi:hypothetical protein